MSGTRFRIEDSESLNPPAWMFLKNNEGTGAPLLVPDNVTSEVSRRYCCAGLQ